MKEVTYEDWLKNPQPREMWVWDNNPANAVKRKVVYFSGEELEYPVIIVTFDEAVELRFKHCAEIEMKRRMTNKELAWWLSEKPHRELKMRDYIYHDYDYKENEQDAEVADLYLIREDGSEWREPLVEETE